MTRYCASFQASAARLGMGAICLCAAGLTQAEPQVAPGVTPQVQYWALETPGGTAASGRIPYLDDSQATAAAAPSWLPFDFLRLDAGVKPLDFGARSYVSGAWLPSESVSVQAWAERAQWRAAPPPGCIAASPLQPGCAAGPQAARAGRSEAMGYGLLTQWQPLEGLRLGVGYHHRDASGAFGLFPGTLDFLSPAWNAGLSVPGSAFSEGVDVNVAYGFDAGLIGQLEFSLRLSHELNRSLQLQGRSLFPDRWQADPLSHARFGFNWSKGDFSGSLSSRYVESIFLNGRSRPASWTTLDINFAWQTPWDASLSVGAKNLLGNQQPGTELAPDGLFPLKLDDSFSSVPYVRYEQDL